MIWTMSRFQIENQDSLDEITMAVRAKTDEHMNNGKQIAPVERIEDPANDQFTSIRTFVDRAAADEWVAFCEPYGPLSVTILE